MGHHPDYLMRPSSGTVWAEGINLFLLESDPEVAVDMHSIFPFVTNMSSLLTSLCSFFTYL